MYILTGAERPNINPTNSDSIISAGSSTFPVVYGSGFAVGYSNDSFINNLYAILCIFPQDGNNRLVGYIFAACNYQSIAVSMVRNTDGWHSLLSPSFVADSADGLPVYCIRQPAIYTRQGPSYIPNVSIDIEASSQDDLVSFINANHFERATGPASTYPITYRLTNASASSAPIEATVGDTVNVPLTFPEGYGIVNPSADAYVMNNGVLVPSTYSNGVLSFTMPDPS